MTRTGSPPGPTPDGGRDPGRSGDVPPRPGGRRPAARVGCLLGAAAALLAACGGPSAGSPTTSQPPGQRILVGGRGATAAATLQVVNGATSVTVSSASLGPDLYRVGTPSGSGLRPLVTRHGSTVRVGDTGAGPTTRTASLDIVLARGVRWTIDLDGGATTETVDMGGGSLTALDFGAGVSMASARLPDPVGTQTVTLAGGASQLVVVAPPGAPAQVEATGGAGHLELDGVDHTGVAGGSVFTDPGWAEASDRYVIDLAAGVSEFRMTRS